MSVTAQTVAIDEAILEALAQRGRVYLLWELEAAGAMGQLGFESTKSDLEPAEATFEAQMDAYAKSLDRWFETYTDDEHETWLEHVEYEYGPVADIVMDQFAESD